MIDVFFFINLLVQSQFFISQIFQFAIVVICSWFFTISRNIYEFLNICVVLNAFSAPDIKLMNVIIIMALFLIPINIYLEYFFKIWNLN